MRGRRFAGFRFRRRPPIGSSLAAFDCSAAKPVIEPDCDSRVGKADRDAWRQCDPEGEEFVVLRFWDPDVYDELEAVLDTIWFALERRCPMPAHPSPPAPPPHGGRGEEQ